MYDYGLRQGSKGGSDPLNALKTTKGFQMWVPRRSTTGCRWLQGSFTTMGPFQGAN